VLVVALAGVGFTEWRLWQGMDLRDESYYVVLPYRFSVGTRPFVDETGFLQLPSLLEYPLVKPFVAAQGGRANGIMMYTRHLYFVLVLCVGAAAFCALRRLLRWQFAALVATLYVTFVFIARPQLSYNTMGMAFITLGVAFGLVGILSKEGTSGRLRPMDRRALGWLVAAGVMHGLAGFAFPTLWIMPVVYVVALWLTLRRRPRREPASDGIQAACSGGEVASASVGARRPMLNALAAYGGGAAALLLVEAGVLLMFGLSNLRSSFSYSYAGVRTTGQVGGWPKLVKVIEELVQYFWGRPYFLAAGLVLYLILRRWPHSARSLLILLPFPLYVAGNYQLLQEGGFAIVFVFLAPYLYLFLPQRHRPAGRTLLLWAVAPALLGGLVTAWTSADGYQHAAVGLFPGFMASGAFLVWALADGWRGVGSEVRALAWAGRFATTAVVVALVALVGITIEYQFQFIARFEPYSALTAWVGSGPFWGVHTTPQRRAYLEQLASDLKAYSTPRDRLLVDSEFPAAYLFWPYRTATNSVWIASPPERSPLPEATVAWMRAHRTVPDIVLRTVPPGDLSDAEYLKNFGLDLGYAVVLRRANYVLLRRPSGVEPAFMHTR
jgi:hypothetical protein